MLAAVLTAPKMAVTVVGDALQVSFNKLPLTAVVMVTVWKRGEELQVRVYLPLFPLFCFFRSFLSFTSSHFCYFYILSVLPFTILSRSQAAVYTMPAEQSTLPVHALQEGAVYCVTAQTVLDTQLSSSTDAQCVTITGTCGSTFLFLNKNIPMLS